MKKILTTVYAVLLLGTAALAQTINWKSLSPEQKHIVNLQASLDYSASFEAGYGYQIKSKLPVVLSAQLSIPAGDQFMDDFKSKLGGQVRVYTYKSFAAMVSVHANVRAHQTDLVKLQSFGSEFTGVAGFYKPKWFAAAEFGFDKAIATHIKHRDQMKQYYPDIRDGWYVPTAGNINFGVQGGYTLNTFDVTLRIGKIVDQSFHTTAMLPYYLQIGVNKRF